MKHLTAQLGNVLAECTLQKALQHFISHCLLRWSCQCHSSLFSLPRTSSSESSWTHRAITTQRHIWWLVDLLERLRRQSLVLWTLSRLCSKLVANRSIHASATQLVYGMLWLSSTNVMATEVSSEASNPVCSPICQALLLAGVSMNISSGYFGKRIISSNWWASKCTCRCNTNMSFPTPTREWQDTTSSLFGFGLLIPASQPKQIFLNYYLTLSTPRTRWRASYALLSLLHHLSDSPLSALTALTKQKIFITPPRLLIESDSTWPRARDLFRQNKYHYKPPSPTKKLCCVY